MKINKKKNILIKNNFDYNINPDNISELSNTSKKYFYNSNLQGNKGIIIFFKIFNKKKFSFFSI